MALVSRSDVPFGPEVAAALEVLDGLDVVVESGRVMLPGHSLEDLTDSVMVRAARVPADRLALLLERLMAAGAVVSSDSPRSVGVSIDDPATGVHVAFQLDVSRAPDAGVLASVAASAALEFIDACKAAAGDEVSRFGAVPVALYRAGRRGEAFGMVAESALLVCERSLAGMAPRVDERADLLARLLLDESALDASTTLFVRAQQAGRKLRDVLVTRPELVDVALALDAPGQEPLFELRPVSVPVRPRSVSLQRAV